MSPLTGTRVVVLNWRDLGHGLGGGAERYAWEMARALVADGAQVTFVCGRDTGQDRRDRIEEIDVRRRGGAVTWLVWAALHLLRHRRRIDAVVDADCGVPAFSPLFVRRSTPVLLVVHHVHQHQFGLYFPRPVAAFGRWVEHTVVPAVYRRTRTVAVSESTRAEMRSQLGWRTPVALLPNGADPAPVDAEPLAVPPGRERIVALGRLVPHKRVELILQAVAALAEERPDVSLDVIGRGTERETLEALAVELGIEDRVRFCGFVAESEKHALLSGASLHVCASDVEGWGQVVIEASAHGVPTIARNVPGLRDSIRPGVTGWLVPDHPDATTQLAELVDQMRSSLDLLADPAVRQRTHVACRAWSEQFSWSRMHTTTRALLVTELERRGAAGPSRAVPTTGERRVAPLPSTHTPAHASRTIERGI